MESCEIVYCLSNEKYNIFYGLQNSLPKRDEVDFYFSVIILKIDQCFSNQVFTVEEP